MAHAETELLWHHGTPREFFPVGNLKAAVYKCYTDLLGETLKVGYRGYIALPAVRCRKNELQVCTRPW